MENTPKKKPGRPRKPAVVPSIPALGIVSEPSNAGTADPQFVRTVELVYTNPIMFKRIFSLLKSMEITDVVFSFKVDGLNIIGIDSNNNNTVFVRIYGKQLTRYYCKSPIQMGMQLKGLTAITNTINKEFGTIQIYTNQMMQSSKLMIDLFYDALANNKQYTVPRIDVRIDESSISTKLDAESLYPLKFVWSTKFFKKDITDYNTMCDEIHIRKLGDQPLEMKLEAKKSGVNIDQISVFTEPEKIKMECSLPREKYLHVAFRLEVVKPFATTIVADDVHIAVDENGPLVFTYFLDKNMDQQKKPVPGTEVCVIKVLSETIAD